MNLKNIMVHMYCLLLIICTATPLLGFSQRADTLIQKLDSASKKTDSIGVQRNDTRPSSYDERTNLNFSSFFILQGSDIKQAFTKPFHMSGRDWGSFAKFAAITGSLMLVDEPVQRFASNLTAHNKGIRNTSGFITKFGGLYEGYALAATAAFGFATKNKKMQTTTLLAVQSYITGGLVSAVVKIVAGRQRPYVRDAASNESEQTFWGPFKNSKNAGPRSSDNSFPSGHATVAFAAATVFAMEYRDKPLIPILAYSAATLVGLSRITENKHWLTDVVTGAALGYLSGKLVVNNYHRYANIRGGKQRVMLSPTLQYSFGTVMGGLVCHF